jgi:hypothetical protein
MTCKRFIPAEDPQMPETSKSKRHEAICFQRSLLVADFDYLSSTEVYTFGYI